MFHIAGVTVRVPVSPTTLPIDLESVFDIIAGRVTKCWRSRVTTISPRQRKNFLGALSMRSFLKLRVTGSNPVGAANLFNTLENYVCSVDACGVHEESTLDSNKRFISCTQGYELGVMGSKPVGRASHFNFQDRCLPLGFSALESNCRALCTPALPSPFPLWLKKRSVQGLSCRNGEPMWRSAHRAACG